MVVHGVNCISMLGIVFKWWNYNQWITKVK
jgi:hypothetical protein